MSVGMKREYFLFLKGIFPPSRMTSDEGPYMISGKTFFFPKSRLLMGAAVKNRGCVYHCSKVHAGASACSLLCFPPSPHCKLSQAPTSGGMSLGTAVMKLRLSVQTEIPKTCVSELKIHLDLDRKERKERSPVLIQGAVPK